MDINETFQKVHSTVTKSKVTHVVYFSFNRSTFPSFEQDQVWKKEDKLLNISFILKMPCGALNAPIMYLPVSDEEHQGSRQRISNMCLITNLVGSPI